MTVSAAARDNRERRAQEEVGATTDEQQAATVNHPLPNKLQEVRGASRTANRQQPTEELDDFDQRRLPSQSANSSSFQEKSEAAAIAGLPGVGPAKTGPREESAKRAHWQPRRELSQR